VTAAGGKGAGRRGYERVPGSGDEVRALQVGRRLERLRRLLHDRGATGALLRTRRNFAWLTLGGLNHVVLAADTGEAPILVTAERAVVLSPNIEAQRIADEEIAGLGIGVEPLPWYEKTAIAEAAARLGGANLLADADLEEELIPIRSMLCALEQERLAFLGRETIRALLAALDQATPGETEELVAAAAVGFLAREGIRAPVVLAAADRRIELYRHPLPGPTPIERRLMLVLVAECWGLHAAATRIRDFDPPTAELQRRAAAVEEVQSVLHQATIPGATLGDVFAAAQAAYARVGFADEWQLHHQGGIIGYQGRERVAVAGDATRIQPGMAFAWNPSITGAKAEDTFILGEDAARRFVTSAHSAAEPPA
jgi:Xaa-Pro aminopeptidase